MCNVAFKLAIYICVCNMLSFNSAAVQGSPSCSTYIKFLDFHINPKKKKWKLTEMKLATTKSQWDGKCQMGKRFLSEIIWSQNEDFVEIFLSDPFGDTYEDFFRIFLM